MDESKQRAMVTKSSSSIKRKPLANLTNTPRKPNHTSSLLQSKKPVSSTASDSSIGSTQNPINLYHPILIPPDQPIPSKSQKLTPDHLPGDENQTGQAQRHTTRNTRSTTKADVPFNQTSLRERTNNLKKGSVSVGSSTLGKLKDQGNINQFSTEKIDGKRKSVDVSLSVIKNTKNTDKDKGKENVVSSNSGLTMANDLMRRKEKGKVIAESSDYTSRKKLKNYTMDFNGPLKGVVINEKDGTIMGSGGVSTPIKYHTLEKKNQQISCPPILKTMSNRNDDADVEEVYPSKIQTEPPPKKKKRGGVKKEEYTLPKEFVEQQRAYFKEIDDFELEVEEVSD